ncbi:MAG TPA: hybrid sensor histidine kinase/response regulator [Gemmatimonadaceae bacterium]|jgi:signal transduction histidine kinase|nr:hybrid sensor histidine kinase/response regulator [Gemmatimonadaceae bacterium]
MVAAEQLLTPPRLDVTTLQNQRVLCVDDSRAILAFLSALLTPEGATVDEVINGEDAIARHATGGPYHLILLDILLPDIDGMDVLRRIRERDQDCTIVILTGVGGVSSATKAMQAGADGYIEKQYLAGRGGEPEFFYALKQALEHRAGYVAQRKLHELRTQFYSMVTHDLRNPAGTVLGLLKAVLDGKAGPLTPRQEHLLATARSAATKFVNLITNYLDYSTIEAGYLRLTKTPTDLTKLVLRSVQQAEILATAREQKLFVEVPETPLMASADAEKLEQIFDNLISNAIKYTPDTGRITVSLHHDGDDAVFSVADTGNGISPDQVEKLFTKYTRLSGPAITNEVGTGLGLAIVKEIVEAHGGSVTAQSTAGAGSTFIARIPLTA